MVSPRGIHRHSIHSDQVDVVSEYVEIQANQIGDGTFLFFNFAAQCLGLVYGKSSQYSFHSNQSRGNTLVSVISLNIYKGCLGPASQEHRSSQGLLKAVHSLIKQS